MQRSYRPISVHLAELQSVGLELCRIVEVPARNVWIC